MSFVGLVPAAGRATRLPPLACSKEVFPLDPLAEPSERTSCERLLARMRLAGAERAYVVVGHGKWDIPAYLDDGSAAGVPVAYLTIRDSPSTPATVARAAAFVADDLVAFGFPDILFEPADAFVRLRARAEEGGADVVLGLLPAARPELVDLVELDEDGRVVRVEIKPARTELRDAWVLAVWTPRFTRFLRDWSYSGAGEPYVGHVVQSAVEAGLDVRGLRLPGGGFRDLGTPAELEQALAERQGRAGPRPTAT